jgi:hypothetical protein
MTIAKALREGMRRLNAAKRIVFLVYVVTTATGLLGTAVIMSVVAGSLGHSLWARQMAANFDSEWVAELAARHGSLLAAPWAAAIPGVLAIFAVIYLFLLGGVLEVLCAGAPVSPGSYFGGCGKHFWRLFRLTLWTAPCAVVPAIAGGILSRIGNRLWGAGSVETPLVYWSWFRILVVLCGFALVNLAFEYAAIGMAAEDSRRSGRALLGAFRLTLRRPEKTLVLYASLCLILALTMAAGFGVSRIVAQTSAAAVLALFLFRQAAVLAKTWSWLLFFPAQAAMWEAIKPAPSEAAPAPAEVTAAPGEIASSPAPAAEEGAAVPGAEITPAGDAAQP